jgi:phage shock protein A
MTIGERERLLRRIRQIRRTTADREQQEAAAVESADEDPIRVLQERVAHLERLLEGLQDSVHREFRRHEEQITALRDEIDPTVLGAALAEHARSRGL